MTDEKYLDLLNREIDGVNSQKDSSKLKEYLVKNPEAQELYNELVTVSDVLKKVRVIEPSPNLRKNILNAIPSSKYAVKEKESSLKSLMSALFFRYKMQYAYAFVAGLMVGVVVYSFFATDKHPPSDLTTLYGTMLSPETSEGFQIADVVEIDLDEIAGTVTMKYSKGVVLAEVDLESQKETEIVLEFDENDIRFHSFGQLNSAKNEITVDKNSVGLTNTGENTYVIFFEDKTQSITPMTVKILSSGTLLSQNTVFTGPISE